MSSIRKPQMMNKSNVGEIEKAKDFIGTIKKLATYLKKDLLAIIVALIIAIGSVACMVILPQYLGDTTDILISGIIQKQAYKTVQTGYEKVENLLNKVDEIKQVVYEINSDPNYDTTYYDLVSRDCSVGILVNFAKDPNSTMEEDLKEKIFSIPEEMYEIPLRRVMGYYFNGVQVHEPIYNQDKTFREYLEYIEYDLEVSNDVPQSLLNVFLDMKINDPNCYYILNVYNDSETIGEFIKKLNLENSISVPKAYLDIVYSMSLHDAPEINWDLFVKMIIKLAILAAIYSICSYLQGFILAGVAQRVAYNMRKDVSEKINKLPLSYFDKVSNGEIMSLITNDIDSVSNALNQTISQICTFITTVIGMFIMMLRISWLLTLIAVSCVAFSFISMAIIIRVSQKRFKAQQENIDTINGTIEESFAGVGEIKLYCHEDESIQDFKKLNDELCENSRKSNFISGLMQPISKLIGNLGYVAGCVFGAVLVIDGKITIGSMQSFVQYLRQFTQPFNQVSTMFNMFQSSIASAERVFIFLGQEEEKEIALNELENVYGNVEFKNVSFAYGDKTILDNCSLSCCKGEKIAIVGYTGSGKTTLVKLLMGFYEYKEGEICIDQKPLKSLSKKSVRDHISMVLQDPWLFEGSIMENIKYGNSKASDEDVYNSAKALNLHDYILSLPGGYDYIVNSTSSNLSQGQKQLITILRALISDKEIVILDEATSDIDSLTEKHLQEAVKRLMEEKTSIIIAHRFSTINQADKIAVIEDGKIVEQGRHVELMKNKSYYYELFNLQYE